MPEITSWIGTTWGTNRGSILAELTLDGTQLTGKIQLLEPGVGQTHLKLEGQWTPDHKIHAKLSDFVGTYPVAVFLPQSGEMNAAFDPSENLIHGEWKTDAGTLGKFVLANTSVPITMPQNPAPAIAAPLPQPARIQTPPPALVTLTRVLTSYRLDASALRSLSELVRQDTSIPLSVINGATEGREFIHIGMDSLLADHSLPDVIYEVRVAANEPAVQSGNSTVVV